MISYTKNELVAELSGKLSVTGDRARQIVDEFLGCLGRAFVRTEKVSFRDFGTFDVCVRKARLGRNPMKPAQTYRVPPKRIVRFRAGRELDEALNNSK